MKQKTFRYKNIFTYGSLQFCGNIEEYYSKNTEKVVIFLVMPRLKNKFNLVRFYEKGKLVHEEKVKSSDNIFLYYFYWLFFHWYFLLKYFSKEEKIFMIAGHPVCFFGLSIQKRIRNIVPVYWIGDYFPGGGFAIKLFEKLKKQYHDAITYTCYLSDGINKVFNEGKIVNTSKRKTVMWGVKQKKITKKLSSKQFNILFVGLIKDSQGLEFVFDFLKANKDCNISIIGICDKTLYKKYKALIKELKIKKQVYFPNKFFSDKDLEEISKKSHVGIALYNIDKSNPTYYTDPGKVKAYAEMGVPIIMSNTSGIAPFIKKFTCGEVIDRNEKSLTEAITKIKENYSNYKSGLQEFNNYFYFEKYYKEKLSFLEN